MERNQRGWPVGISSLPVEADGHLGVQLPRPASESPGETTPMRVVGVDLSAAFLHIPRRGSTCGRARGGHLARRGATPGGARGRHPRRCSAAVPRGGAQRRPPSGVPPPRPARRHIRLCSAAATHGGARRQLPRDPRDSAQRGLPAVVLPITVMR
jgi:hypothetical protein